MAEEQKKAESRQVAKNVMQASKRTGTAIVAIVPRNTDELMRVAQFIAESGMAPKSYLTGDIPERRAKIAVGIMMGAELGLYPLQALQNIAVINGMPSIWGDAALALVRSSGQLEYIREEVEEDNEGVPTNAICTVKRKGDPEEVVRYFSRGRAIRAGLWSKSGTWQTDPTRMLQLRARSFALRDVFTDILKGLYFTEEVEDLDDIPDMSLTPPPPPKREDYMATPAEPEVVDVDVEEEAETAEPEGTPDNAPSQPAPEAEVEEPAAAAPEPEPEPEPAGDLDEGSPLFVTFDHDGSQMAEYAIASEYAKGLLSLFNELEPAQYAAFREANMETVKLAFKELPDGDTKADLKDMARKWREGQ